MKKQVLYFAAGVFVTLLVFSFWAFKKDKADSGGGYAVADFYCGPQLTNKDKKINISYSDGTSEEVKFESSALAPDVVILITNKMEPKGYVLQYSNMTAAAGGGYSYYNRLIFKKK